MKKFITGSLAFVLAASMALSAFATSVNPSRTQVAPTLSATNGAVLASGTNVSSVVTITTANNASTSTTLAPEKQKDLEATEKVVQAAPTLAALLGGNDTATTITESAGNKAVSVKPESKETIVTIVVTAVQKITEKVAQVVDLTKFNMTTTPAASAAASGTAPAPVEAKAVVLQNTAGKNVVVVDTATGEAASPEVILEAVTQALATDEGLTAVAEKIDVATVIDISIDDEQIAGEVSEENPLTLSVDVASIPGYTADGILLVGHVNTKTGKTEYMLADVDADGNASFTVTSMSPFFFMVADTASVVEAVGFGLQEEVEETAASSEAASSSDVAVSTEPAQSSSSTLIIVAVVAVAAVVAIVVFSRKKKQNG